MRKAKQSTAKNVMVLMVQSSDHITGLAGLTLTITASKDGGAFSAITPTVTDRGNGWYSLALTTAHTDTLGDLALHITGAAADPADMVILVEGGATDVDVSSRLATAGYTAPDNASISTILTRTDVATSTRLAAASYTAPDNASISAILVNTDVPTSTRMATFATPTNFAALAITAGGTVTAALDTADATKLDEMYERDGLKAGAPAVITPSGLTSAAITQTYATVGNTTTVERV